MRHKYNKLKDLNPGAQKFDLRIRNLLTSLIKNGQIKTTSKKAKILKSEADKFLSHLVGLTSRYDEADAKRLSISYVKSTILGNEEGKKMINEILPKYVDSGQKFGFVSTYKLGYRKGDSAEEVLVKLV
ncbi:Ribosomal protein L17 [Candidatus Vampirococcus lugosii]|uniref:50S ribosomal protein L17 n=2 Tax=Candidatus Vampirococcus lugosii TaxID=2789015 RepID=A0ABS5QJI2_9BACT|nr:Ribosomal protein L17 [Candidatus Vampirococcus lugosii]